MAYKVYSLEDFSKGWYYNQTNNMIPIEGSSVFENVLSMPKNYLRSRKGYSIKNASVTAGQAGGISGAYINGIFQYPGETSTHLLCCSCNTSVTAGYNITALDGACVMKFDESSQIFSNKSVGITYNPTADGIPYFEVFGNNVVIVNSKNYPITWNGAWANFKQFSGSTGGSNYNITGTLGIPKFVKSLKDYLFFGYITEGAIVYKSRIRWCDPGDLSSWTSTNYMDLDADDGDEITGMEILGNVLIVFKERKIYAVRYVGGTLIFDYECIVDGRGCTAGNTINALYTDLIFLAHDGIYRFDGSGITELSAQIKDIITTITPSYRHRSVSMALEEEDQILFSVPHNGSENNNKILLFNYTYWPKLAPWFSYDIPCATFGSYYRASDLKFKDLTQAFKYYDFKFGDRRLLGATPLIASSDYIGNLYTLNETYTDNMASFTTKWEHRYLTFAETAKDARLNEDEIGIRNKRLVRLIFWVKQQIGQTYSMTIRVYTDYDEVNYQTFTITMTDSDFANQTIIEKRVDCSIQGRAFKIGVSTTGLAEAWEIYKIDFIYDIRGRTKRR